MVHKNIYKDYAEIFKSSCSVSHQKNNIFGEMSLVKVLELNKLHNL